MVKGVNLKFVIETDPCKGYHNFFSAYSNALHSTVPRGGGAVEDAVKGCGILGLNGTATENGAVNTEHTFVELLVEPESHRIHTSLG